MTNPNVKLMDTPVAASAMVSSLLGKQSRATVRVTPPCRVSRYRFFCLLVEICGNVVNGLAVV